MADATGTEVHWSAVQLTGNGVKKSHLALNEFARAGADVPQAECVTPPQLVLFGISR